MRPLADGLAAPVMPTNKRIILRSDSGDDAEWCWRILRHAGYFIEARRGCRSAAMYLQVRLRY